MALAALSVNPALAAGTTAGSTITNTVTVDYKVGGFDQTASTDSDAFTVDQKVNLTVEEVGTVTTEVSPGQTAAVTAFSVTNLSNAVLDFALLAEQQAGGTAAHGGTDNFDATNVKIYVDTNGDGDYDAGVDAEVTYLDELAADASVTVFVVVDIPTGLATGDVAGFNLTATAHAGGTAAAQGAALVATTGANTAGMDTVFADAAGTTDLANDGKHSAADDYTVKAAGLTVAKTSRLISDPVNGTTNPKAIPGAVIEYCIAVSNSTGSALATNVTITDDLPAEVTYDSLFGIYVNGTVDVGGVCQADGSLGGSITGDVVSGTLSDIAANVTRTLYFRATID